MAMQRLMTIDPRLATHPTRRKLSPWRMLIDDPTPREKGENLRLFLITWAAGFVAIMTLIS